METQRWTCFSMSSSALERPFLSTASWYAHTLVSLMIICSRCLHRYPISAFGPALLHSNFCFLSVCLTMTTIFVGQAGHGGAGECVRRERHQAATQIERYAQMVRTRQTISVSVSNEGTTALLDQSESIKALTPSTHTHIVTRSQVKHAKDAGYQGVVIYNVESNFKRNVTLAHYATFGGLGAFCGCERRTGCCRVLI